MTMKMKTTAILAAMLSATLASTAMAGERVPSSTDEARAAAGRAQTSISYAVTAAAPARSPITTLDEARLAQRADRPAPRAIADRSPRAITSLDEARAAASQPRSSGECPMADSGTRMARHHAHSGPTC